MHHFLNGFLGDRKMGKKTFCSVQIADHGEGVGEQNKKVCVCVCECGTTNKLKQLGNFSKTGQRMVLQKGWKNESGEAIEENCFCAPHCSVFVSSCQQLVNTKEGFVEVRGKAGK